MKVKNIIKFAFAVLAICVSIRGKMTAHAAQEQPLFPGSELKLADAVKRAEVIALGSLVQLGDALMRAGGQVAYHDAQFKLTKFLKGTSAHLVR